jgi:hypothetical protein
MSICKRRDRIVVFRVTDEEHQQLQQACESSGGRNLSEFVRLEMLNRTQSRKALRVNIASLEKRLSDLEACQMRASGTLPESESKSSEIR